MRTDRPDALQAPDPAPVPPPPAISSQPSGPGPDARMAACGEDAVWFRSLPPKGQDEYRARWAAVAGREVGRKVRRRGSYQRGAARGTAVFLVTHLMFGFGGWTGLTVAAVVGALLGLVWVWFDCGPIASALVAAPVYAAVWLPFMPSLGLAPLLLCFATLMVMSLSVAAGQTRVFRRDDGDEP